MEDEQNATNVVGVQEKSLRAIFESFRDEVLERDRKISDRVAVLEEKLFSIIPQLNKVDEVLDFVREGAGAISLYSTDSQEWAFEYAKPHLSLPEEQFTLSPDTTYLKISGIEWHEHEFGESPKKRKKKLRDLVRGFFTDTLSMPPKEVKHLSLCEVLIGNSFPQDESPRRATQEIKSLPFVVIGFEKASDVEAVKEYKKIAKIQGYNMEDVFNDDDHEYSPMKDAKRKRNSLKKHRLTAG